ncbi:MAG: PSP1 C-terminal domain-containing protein [Pirellulaceae bacterium]
MNHYLVRIGQFGHVGRFRAAGAEAFARRMRVVCRTDRGLEIGEVLSASGVASDGPRGQQVDGALLRRMTTEDELLADRLQRNKDEAYSHCVSLLRERQLDAVLMDVEPLFDGSSLYFYFLGGVSAEVEAITEQLAAAYEAKAGLRRFADTLVTGCGPDCGTEAAAGGCGTGGCAGCSIAGACSTTPQA